MGSMKDQLGDNLFDYVDRQQSAVAAKQEGMARAEAHAAPGWADSMYALVVEVAKSSAQFTSDDVFDLADARGVPMTHDGRAFGPVMMRAARGGVCCKANVAARPSRRASNHARPVAVWDSLIHKRGHHGNVS